MALGTTTQTMRVVIVDDHPLYLDAVRRQISRAFRNAEIFATTSLDEAIANLSQTPANLVMLDCSMPGMDGTEGVRRVVAEAGKAPVLMMSGVASTTDIAACLSHGAKGFLPKTMEGRVFADAVSIVLHGGTYLPAEFMASALTEAATAASNAGGLSVNSFSPRETELLRLVVGGESNKEIARQMGLQEVTVKFYLTRLFRRLGVKNRSQAAVVAARMGLGAAVA